MAKTDLVQADKRVEYLKAHVSDFSFEFDCFGKLSILHVLEPLVVQVAATVLHHELGSINFESIGKTVHDG